MTTSKRDRGGAHDAGEYDCAPTTSDLGAESKRSKQQPASKPSKMQPAICATCHQLRDDDGQFGSVAHGGRGKFCTVDEANYLTAAQNTWRFLSSRNRKKLLQDGVDEAAYNAQKAGSM